MTILAGGTSTRVTERLDRAKATGELRADVDAAVVETVLTGAAFHAATTHPRAALDDAWVSSVVGMLLGGLRPTPTTDGGTTP